MDDRSIEKLVIAARTGDRNAYANLISIHYRTVYLTCLGILGLTEPARNLAQQAFLKGYSRINSLRKPARFAAWISGIARKLCLNYAKSHKNQPDTGKSDHVHLPKEDLQAAIAQLPPELRRPLLLYYFDGKNARTIATRLRTTPSAVYQKLRSAIRHLHEITEPTPEQEKQHCENTRKKIIDKNLGLLSQLETRSLNHHIDGCDRCRRFAYEIQQQRDTMIRLGKDIDAEITEGRNQAVTALNRLPSSVIPDKAPLFTNIIFHPATIAVAALIIIAAAIFLIYPFNRTINWQQTIDAFNNTPHININIQAQSGDGKEMQENIWLTRPDKIRIGSPEQLIIDDGTEILILNKKTKTAKIAKSTSNTYNLYERPGLSILQILDTEPKTRYEIKSAETPNPNQLACNITDTENENSKIKILINAKTFLPEQIQLEDPDQANPDLLKTVQINFTYESISDTLFSTAIPPGYKTESATSPVAVKPVKSIRPVKSVESDEPDEPEGLDIDALLAQLEQDYQNDDIPALVTGLASDIAEISFAAADYLAEIGQISEIEHILKASNKHKVASQENPYVNAIKKILERSKQTEPPIIQPPVTQPPKNQPITFTGHIIDEETNPVPNALVTLTCPERTNPIQYIKATADQEGNFTLTAPADIKTLSWPITFWATIPDQPEFIAWTALGSESAGTLGGEIPGHPGDTPDTQSCTTGAENIVLVMQPALQVAGTVTDPNGLAITDADLDITFELTDVSAAPVKFPLWQVKTKTESDGTYIAAPLPILWDGCIISVTAKAPGYLSETQTAVTQDHSDILELDIIMQNSPTPESP